MPGVEQPKVIQLQPRDFELLRDLYESRIMRLDQIAALHFDGKSEAAKKRVARLKRAGYIRERPRRSNEPAIHFLGRRAIIALEQHGHLAGYPHLTGRQLETRLQVSDLTLRHELEVMDVKAAMVKAIRKTEYLSIAQFSTWPRLHEFEARGANGRRVLVKPDGFIRVLEQEADGGLSEHTFFLEVDRSTETLDIIADRCHCYLDYYRSGGFAMRNGATREEYKGFPFRVLVVCKSEARRDNIANRLLRNNPPIGAQVWLTTMAEMADPLNSIWTRPGDHQILSPRLRKSATLRLLSIATRS